MARKGKGKSKSKDPPLDPDSQSLPTITEDETSLEATSAFLGTALVDIRQLDPKWTNGPILNRELDATLISQRCQSFAAGIRRYSEDTRIKVSCGKDEFHQYLLHQAHSIMESPTENQTTLEQVVEKLRLKCQAKAISQDPFVALDLSREGLPKPTLDAGQHRRAALLRVNGLAAQHNAEYRQQEKDPQVPDPTTKVALDMPNPS